MSYASWPSFARVLEIDKIYSSTVANFSELPDDLKKSISGITGDANCKDYFRLHKTSRDMYTNFFSSESHPCKLALSAFKDIGLKTVNEEERNYNVIDNQIVLTKIDYKFVKDLNEKFKKLITGMKFEIKNFFTVLEIVADADMLSNIHIFNFEGSVDEGGHGGGGDEGDDGGNEGGGDLSGDGGGDTSLSFDMEALATIIRKSPSLTKVNLDGFDLPIKELKGTNPVNSLDLSEKGLRPASAIVIADLISDNASMTVVDLRYNNLDTESATMLATVANQISLCGITSVQTEADLSYDKTGKYMSSVDAILLAADLKVRPLLTSINLQDNSFDSEGAKALAPAIRDSRSLTSIDLSNNRLGLQGAKALAPAVRDNARLTSIGTNGLNLKGNRFYDDGWGAIFAAVCSSTVKMITSVDASNERIGQEGAKQIGQALRNSVNTSMASIDLSNNNLMGSRFVNETQLPGSNWKKGDKVVREGEELTVLQEKDSDGDVLLGTCTGVIAIAEAIRASSLKSLDVRHNNISGDGASQLSAAVLGHLKMETFNEIPIKEMRSNFLTKIDFKGKDIGIVGGMVVAGLLTVVPSIRVVDLRYNDMDTEIATMLAAIGKKKSISLCGITPEQTEANFSSYDTDRYMRLVDVILLTADLTIRTSLKSIDLSVNYICAEGAKALAPALRDSSSLTSIKLESNNFGSEGARALATAIHKSRSMASINLSNDNLTESKFVKETEFPGLHLKKGDKVNRNGQVLTVLKETDSGGNVLLGSFTGVIAIAQAIRVTTSLTSIYLRLNNLGSEGAKALAPAIRDSHSLTSINLGLNYLGSEGAKALASAIRANASLCHLDVRENCIFGDGAAQLSAAVLGHLKMETFNGIRIKEMRDSLLQVELNLRGRYLDVIGGMVVASFLTAMTKLTRLNLSKNKLAGDTGYVKATAVQVGGGDGGGQGLAFNVGDKVIYQNCEMIVSKGTNDDGKIKMVNLNGIKAIADALRVHPSITKLSLAHNNLGEEGTKTICEAAGENKRLKEIDLRGTSISDGNTNIGGAAGAKHVKTMLATTVSVNSIDVGYNDIGQLASLDLLAAMMQKKKMVAEIVAGKEVKTVAEMESIGMAGCELGVEGGKVVAKLLSNPMTLVNLSNNKLCGIDEKNGSGTYNADGIMAIADAIKLSSSITTINLSKNVLGPKGAEALAIAFNSSLTSIDISENDIGYEGAKALVSAIKASRSLTDLNIGRNNIGGYFDDEDNIKETPEGTIAIADALRNNTSLTAINLENNNLGKAAKELGEAIGASTSITNVSLSTNFIGGHYPPGAVSENEFIFTPEGPEAIAAAIRLSSSLKTIDLTSNGISSQGAIALAHAINDSNSLSSLDVGFNLIGQSASLKLLDAMQSKKMMAIGMAKCNLGVEGSKVVANMISVMPSLTFLDVRNNGILSGDGASQLSAAVLKHHAMEKFNEIPIKKMRRDLFTYLELRHKGVEVAGSMVVAGLLPAMPSLISIDLKNNNIDEAGKISLRKAVMKRAGLKLLPF